MDSLVVGFSSIAALLVLVALRVPVGIAMAVVSVTGLGVVAGLPFVLTTAETLPYAVASEYAFVVVPMFMLMGALTAATGITGELYTAAHRWTSGVKGSLYYATTLASGGFGAINGSTVVSSVLFTKIALPEMQRFGYSMPVSAGCICAAGTFAALIPPSIAMVIYALLTNQSVGALLMAGVVPGLLTIGVYLVGIRLLLAFRPDIAPGTTETFTWSEKLRSLKSLWAVIILITLVMGGIYSGVMFPSAAGAVGAGGALLIGFARRRLDGRSVWESLRESVVMTSVLFLIIIAGQLLSRLLLFSGFVADITAFAGGAGLTLPLFMVGIVVLYLILGMFVDGVSMMVMTVPFLHPIASSLGADPIWFGVVIVKLIEIGAITPPVGMNLFAVIGASKGAVKAATLYRGVAPFLLMELVTLGLIIGVPTISLWLPRQMF